MDVVDGDAGVALALGVFKGPELFAVFVGDGDGFAFSGDKGADDVRGFDQDGEALVGGGWVGVLMSAFLPTGMRIYDISNPSNAVQVGRFSTNGYTPSSVTVTNGYAYLAAGSAFEIVNVTNPASPSLVTARAVQAAAFCL